MSGRRWFVWLRRGLFGLLGLAAALALAVALAPSAVSTGWFRSLLEREATALLRRPLTVGTLRWGWADGLLVEGLVLADVPAFSPEPLLRLGRLRVRPDLSALLRRRAVVDLTVDGLAVRFVRTADGAVNWAPVLAALRPEPKPPKPPSPLPVDVSARVRVDGVVLDAEDRGQGRTLRLGAASLSADAPSLLTRPVRASLRCPVAVDGAPASPIALDLTAAGLYAPDGAPTPDRVAADVRLAAPGLEAAARTRLASRELQADLRLDLAPLLAVARPLLPPRIVATEASGTVTLAAEASGAATSAAPAPFRATLGAQGLRASGGGLAGRGLEPVTLTLATRGAWTHETRGLTVEEGTLRLQERTHARWAAAVAALGGPEERFRVELGPALFDLREVLALAAPVLKPGLVPELGPARGAPAELSLAGLRFEGSRDGDGRASVEGLRAAVPALGLGTAEGRLAASALSLDVPRASADLGRWFPSAAELEGRLRLGALRRGTLGVERLDLAGLRLAARGLRRSRAEPFGLLGTVEARQELSVGRLDAGDFRVAGLRESLRGRATLGPKATVDARVDRLRVEARSASGAASGTRLAVSGGKAAAAVEIAGVRVGGPLKGGVNPVAAERAGASIPSLTLRRGGDVYALRGLDLSVRRAVGELRDRFPASAGAEATFRLGRLDASGRRRARLSGLRVDDLAFSASGLRRSPGALAGLAGRVAVRDHLALESLDAPGVGHLRGFSQALAATAELGAEVRGRVETLRAAARSVRWEDPARGPLEAPLDLDVSAGALRLAAGREADVRGLEARVELGPLLSARLTASALGSGRRALTSAGRLQADLDRLPRRLVASLRPGLGVGGAVSAAWDFDGRLPRPAESGAWRAAGGRGPAPFLERGGVSAVLRGVRLSLPLGKGQAFAVSGVSTAQPLTLSLGPGGSALRASLRAVVGAVERLPSLAPLDLPPRAVVAVEVSGDLPRSLRVNQSLEVDLFRLRQTARAEVAGLERLAARGFEKPWPGLLRLLTADAEATLEAGRGAGRVVAGRDLSWDGPLAAEARLRLVPARDLRLAARVESSGLDATVGQLARVQDLRAHLTLDKTLWLAAPSPGAAGERGRPFLSRAVLEAPSLEAAPGAGLRAVADQLRGQFRGPPSLSLASARVRAGGLALDLGRTELDLRLEEGLPALDRLRVDLLGGTVVGSATVSPEGEALPLAVRLGFTGLDGRRLAPGALGGLAGPEAELGGQVALAAPLASPAGRLLTDAAVDLRLAPIGRRALDGFLFGLDPTGTNEALAERRRLLRTANPRWVRVGVRDGRLSLGGEAAVKGVGLRIPPVEGVNLSELPVRDRLDAALAKLKPLVDGLRLASADTLEIGEGGALRLTRRQRPAPRREIP